MNVLSLIYAEYSYISQRQIFAGSAIICPTHTLLWTCAENSFYKFWTKLFWVSAICAQIL